MTERVNPSQNRSADAFETAGAIALAGGADSGWVSESSSPSELTTQNSNLTDADINAFGESHSGSSFDVTIDGGEAFVYGSWLAIDTDTTVTLASSTNNQTVYVGWDKDDTDDVIVGLDADFASSGTDTDMKIPLWDFDTDGSGVTSATDRRVIGKVVNGRHIPDTNSVTSAYTTSGENIIFADTSGGAFSVTLGTGDLIDGNEIVVADTTGSAQSNNITVDTEGSENIDGQNSVTINNDYGALRFSSDGSNWFTTGGSSSVSFGDDEALNFGDSPDYWFVYDSGNSRLELVSTDVDGGGTDGVIFSIDDGDDILDITDDINFPNTTGTPTFTTHDHAEGGMTIVPVGGIDHPTLLVNSPELFPRTTLDDTESIEKDIVVPDGETLTIYRWGVHRTSDDTAPTNLDIELLDETDSVDTTANTTDNENTAGIASITNSSGGEHVYTVRLKNDTGSSEDVAGHVAYDVA